MVFGWSQIVIDLQPLMVMLSGKSELHGFSHTLFGATLIAILCGMTGKHLGEFGLRLVREPRHLPITWKVSYGSAFIGTYSHILIDSIMHSDVFPFYPFGSQSPLNAIISVDALHIACLTAAVLGGLVWYVLNRFSERSTT